MTPTGRLHDVDLLRFIAAMAVVAFHFPGKWGTAEGTAFHPILGVTHYGQYGVHLFFMISGFVILMSVWGRSAGDFAVSRFVRLMPAYWFSVLVLGILVLKWGKRPLWEILPNLTLLQEPLGVPYLEVVYWSLWVEIRFYLLILVLAAVGTSYRNTLIFMGIWLLGSLFAMSDRDGLLHDVLVAGWSPYFIGGMALYLVYRHGNALAPWAFAAVSWILALRIHGSTTPAAGAIVTGIFVVMALAATGALSRLTVSSRAGRVYTALGALTYPLYLFHSQIGSYMVGWFDPLLGPGPTMALAVAAALAISYGIYRLVERPLQRRLRASLRSSLAQIRGRAEAGPRSARSDERAVDHAVHSP